MPNRKRSKRKNPAAVALGRRGGLRRAQTVMQVIPAEKRAEYARHAAVARWAKAREKKEETEA